jgi:tripartite-type tricarboxylate transporter receptor subunit TctC
MAGLPEKRYSVLGSRLPASRVDQAWRCGVKLIRRQFLLFTAAALAMSARPRLASTQSIYPSRPVRVIVPFPPGGAGDIFARPVAQKLGERLGKPFYVDNIAGAGGNAGTGQAAKAAPDGYTVLFAFGSFAVNPSLYAKVPYDPHKDFEPVTLAVAITTALTVNPSVPAKTVKELIDLIRANPGKYSFASPGLGTQPHLTGEQLRLSLALDLVHVPFTGAGPSNTSVVAGHTPIGFSTLAAAVPLITDGKLRVLAVTSKTRSQTLPDVPTMSESGYPDIAGDSWIGVLVPAKTPKDIIGALHREIVQIIGQPDMRERLVTLGYEPVASTPEEFAQFIKTELETWGKVIRAADIKMQ